MGGYNRKWVAIIAAIVVIAIVAYTMLFADSSKRLRG
jgi:hypothetical protein